MESADLKVAIVDDDEVVRRALRRMVSSLSYTPVEFASGEEFLSVVSDTSFFCALVDMHMPGLNGVDIILRLRRQGINVPAIIITGGDVPSMRERCMRAGAADYLIKPVERNTVSVAIRSLLS